MSSESWLQKTWSPGHGKLERQLQRQRNSWKKIRTLWFWNQLWHDCGRCWRSALQTRQVTPKSNESKSFATATLNCRLGLHANNGLQGKKNPPWGCASLTPGPKSALPVTQTGRVGPKGAACLKEESCIFCIFAMFCSSSPQGTCKVVTAETERSGRISNQHPKLVKDHERANTFSLAFWRTTSFSLYSQLQFRCCYRILLTHCEWVVSHREKAYKKKGSSRSLLVFLEPAGLQFNSNDYATTHRLV